MATFFSICIKNKYNPFCILNEILYLEKDTIDTWFFISFLFSTIYFCKCNLTLYTQNIQYTFCTTVTILFLLLVVQFKIHYLKYLKQLVLWISYGILISFVICIIQKPKYSNIKQVKTENFYVKGIVDTITPSSFGSRTDAKIIRLRKTKIYSHNETYYSNLTIHVYANNKDLASIKHGDLVKVFAKQRNNTTQLLPDGYNFNLKQISNHIELSCFSLSKFQVLHNPNSHDIITQIYNFRYNIYKQIRLCLPTNIADFASALIIGESQGINNATKESMRNSGLSHILCVSGLHLSLLSIFCFKLSITLFNLSNTIALRYNIHVLSYIVTIICSTFYWIISGMNIATTRAFIMTGATIFANVIHRRSNALRILGLSMIIILMYNPIDALMPSFQLSFSATAALILSGHLKNIDITHNENKRTKILNNIINNVKNNFYTSILVSIATAPIVIYHFYSISNYQCIANLLAVPITGLFLMPCVICALILQLFNSASIVYKVMSIGIEAIIQISIYFSNLPYSVYCFGCIEAKNVILALIGIIFIQIFKQKVLRYTGIIMFVTSIVLIIITPKPDIIIDNTKNIIGINTNNTLTIYAKSMSKFLQKYWCNWFGQNQVILHKLDISKTNLTINNKNHKLLIYNTPEDNNDIHKHFDIVINLYDDSKNFIANYIVTKSELEKLSTSAIFIQKDKCTVKGLNGVLTKYKY